MMNDMKKLCKRDALYWLIAAMIMLGLVTYMTSKVLGKYLNETMEVAGNVAEVVRVDAPADMIQAMMMGILETALVVQAVKLLFQETKNRAEMLNLLPVKSRSRLTYHFMSGLIMAGLPILAQTVIIRLSFIYVGKRADIIFEGADALWSYAAKAVLIFMLQYSLFIFCRKLTNHVVGTVFTFVIMEWAMQVAVGRWLGMYWNNLTDDRILNWIFWTVVTVAFIILSYIAEQKKDYARNGFYAFPIGHWLVMGIVFLEVCYIFYDAYDTIPKVVSWLLMIAVALLITAGVHFLARAKDVS